MKKLIVHTPNGPITYTPEMDDIHDVTLVNDSNPTLLRLWDSQNRIIACYIAGAFLWYEIEW